MEAVRPLIDLYYFNNKLLRKVYEIQKSTEDALRDTSLFTTLKQYSQSSFILRLILQYKILKKTLVVPQSLEWSYFLISLPLQMEATPIINSMCFSLDYVFFNVFTVHMCNHLQNIALVCFYIFIHAFKIFTTCFIPTLFSRSIL